MNMRLVSIIMPCYNASLYIKDAIESVVAQTYTCWELIVVDDCSTDNSIEIVEACAKLDDRIKLVKLSNNGGVANARNVGLNIAGGQYVAFLDSDDKWRFDKLQMQIDFMSANSCCFCYSQYQNFNTGTGELGKTIKVPARMTAKKLLGNTAIGCLTVVIDRAITGDFKMPLLKHAEDSVTWYEILSRGFCAYGIQDTLAYYRVGNSSLTSNKLTVIKRQWNVYRNHFHFSFIKSAVLFLRYAVNAVIKHLF